MDREGGAFYPGCPFFMASKIVHVYWRSLAIFSFQHKYCKGSSDRSNIHRWLENGAEDLLLL